MIAFIIHFDALDWALLSGMILCALVATIIGSRHRTAQHNSRKWRPRARAWWMDDD